MMLVRCGRSKPRLRTHRPWTSICLSASCGKASTCRHCNLWELENGESMAHDAARPWVSRLRNGPQRCSWPPETAAKPQRSPSWPHHRPAWRGLIHRPKAFPPSCPLSSSKNPQIDATDSCFAHPIPLRDRRPHTDKYASRQLVLQTRLKHIPLDSVAFSLAILLRSPANPMPVPDLSRADRTSPACRILITAYRLALLPMTSPSLGERPTSPREGPPKSLLFPVVSSCQSCRVQSDDVAHTAKRPAHHATYHLPLAHSPYQILENQQQPRLK